MARTECRVGVEVAADLEGWYRVALHAESSAVPGDALRQQADLDVARQIEISEQLSVSVLQLLRQAVQLGIGRRQLGCPQAHQLLAQETGPLSEPPADQP